MVPLMHVLIADKFEQSGQELAIALILALDRRIADNVVPLSAGPMEQSGVFKGPRTSGPQSRPDRRRPDRTEMVPRAKPFGMSVVARSRSPTPDVARELGAERQATPVDLARSRYFTANESRDHFFSLKHAY